MEKTFMTRVIGENGTPVTGDRIDLSGSKVTDGHDDQPVRLEVTVSVGEFDEGQTLIEVFDADGRYQMLCLDFTAAHRLMCALKDGLAIHAAQSD